MPRRQPPQGYYTASRAKRILGDISDGMLRTYVQKGDIRRIVPEGRTQGFYVSEDVDKVARRLNEFFVTEKRIPPFTIATQDDIPATMQIGTAIFGSEGTSLERRLRWMEKNPEIFYVVRSARGEVLGFACILPLSPDKIAKILREEEHPSDITPEEIQEFKPGEPIDIYVAALCVKPGLPLIEEHRRGFQLVAGLMQVLIDLGHRGIPIRTLFARSRLVDGIRTLLRLGFTEIASTAPSKQRHFIIRVDESGLPFILQYKEALQKAQSKGEK